MFNIGPLELMVLLVLALIVFGPAKLPELMASAGNAIREFQRASRELTSVFEETQSEFTSVMNIDDLMQSVEPDATVASSSAPENSVEHPSNEGTATDSVIPVNVAPAEYETAAGMIDPFEPFEAPAQDEIVAPVPFQSGPEEYATSAGLVEPPLPFDSMSDSATIIDDVLNDKHHVQDVRDTMNGHVEMDDHAKNVDSHAESGSHMPIAVGRTEQKVP